MKKIIDILAIALPALIIFLGIARLFMRKTKGVNGLTMLFAILLLVIGVIRYLLPEKTSNSHESKATPLAVSKHSDAFNKSVENILTAYYKMTEDFSTENAEQIAQSINSVKSTLDSFKIDELKVDSLIYQTALQPYNNAKVEVSSMYMDHSMLEKRASLNIFSNELFSLLSTVRYDKTKLYWLECTEAFGTDKPGNWIGKTEQAANPYGKENCIETRTTLNFVPADTTKKL